ncbi:MAG: hypothetical protein GY754_23230, partial [bacterium]|nr:hypothetical protein [bacterium]
MFSKSIKSVVFISLLVSCSQCACEKALDSIKKFSDTALFDIELVNLPYSITNNKRLNITVQKADSYKFKIDKGEWSKEFDNSIPLTIDYDLSPGFHTVYIKGKIAGKWQNESRISYHKWSINIKTQFSSQTGIAGDFEGRSVAASADGSTIIMGADGNDEKGSQAGAVYVYRWDGNSWSEKKIVASDGEKDDCFGTSVAISSDGNTIIVGAYGNDEEGSQAGAAYIYKWNGSSWKETNKFYGKARLNYFGMSVSISPDGNSIIIGAYGNNEKGVQAGAAYLYKWSGSSWKETNKFYGEARLNYFG